jgi:hypothetical protein
LKQWGCIIEPVFGVALIWGLVAELMMVLIVDNGFSQMV